MGIALILCLSISVITTIISTVLYTSPKIMTRLIYERHREVILCLFFIPLYIAIGIFGWLVYVDIWQ
jgi:hypothetical protein